MSELKRTSARKCDGMGHQTILSPTMINQACQASDKYFRMVAIWIVTGLRQHGHKRCDERN